MNPDTRLEFPIDTVPKNGTMYSINDQIHWVRMPLPMSLNHINLWLIGSKDQATLVDTGMFLDDVKTAWKDLISKEKIDIKKLIVTHMHPDHIGLAGWFVKKFNVPLCMSRTDYLQCRLLAADTGEYVPYEAINFYTQAGLSEKQIKNYIERFGFFGSIIHKLPDAYNRIKHGDMISIAGDEWECIEGRGHTMEHICLFSKAKNLLISGDQLLPKITSHVGVFPTEPNANPLDDWLESCKRLINLVPEDVLVLPAHGRPFLGAHKRLKTIINHHEESLNKLEEFLTTPKRSVDVFPVLFKREIDDSNFLMATGESIAHLNCLIERGLISRNISEGTAFYERV
jgi:glyoxylase-like metal-dependent hydrolase (beta-lactamase superfamily II)